MPFPQPDGPDQLDRTVFHEFHTVLESNADFRSKMRQFGELVERGVHMIYLIRLFNDHIIATTYDHRIPDHYAYQG